MLPPGFDEFEPFLDWALPQHSERVAKKAASTYEEITELYEFGMTDDRIARALRHCDQFPLDAMPDDARRLFLILMSVAEVRPQIEMYGQMDQPGPGAQLDPNRIGYPPERDEW
jgi:hypothetical protein